MSLDFGLTFPSHIRRTIEDDDRIAYTDAVQCLMNKPGKLSIFEGSKYDITELNRPYQASICG